jgi:hypothetical protein
LLRAGNTPQDALFTRAENFAGPHDPGVCAHPQSPRRWAASAILALPSALVAVAQKTSARSRSDCDARVNEPRACLDRAEASSASWAESKSAAALRLYSRAIWAYCSASTHSLQMLCIFPSMAFLAGPGLCAAPSPAHLLSGQDFAGSRYCS